MKNITCTFRKDISPGFKKLMMIMKLTNFLILISVVSAFAGKTYSQTKTLQLSMVNSTVKEVLDAIEDQSDFYFMYSSKVIDVDREVSLELDNKKIDTALKSLFSGTDVEYTIKDRIIVLTTPDVLYDNTLSELQQGSVSGKVTDKTGTPLPGVTVVVKGTTKGTITDVDGSFTIVDIAAEDVLRFSFVGMKMQEIPVGNQTQINVSMEEDAIGLEEVVAIGYGTIKKSDLTGSVTSVETEDLENVKMQSIDQALAGRAAGVQVIQSSGVPGSAPAVRVRGTTSLQGANEPLYVVDGFPIYAGGGSGNAGTAAG